MKWPFGKKEQVPLRPAPPLPDVAVAWKDSWRLVPDPGERAGLQRELETEVGPQHPLANLQPAVFGRCDATDDVVVTLSDGRFAIVHLVWHGKIDAFPKDFPSCSIYTTPQELEAGMELGE